MRQYIENIICYINFYMIGNFYDQEFSDQEFYALVIQCVNFVTQCADQPYIFSWPMVISSSVNEFSWLNIDSTLSHLTPRPPPPLHHCLLKNGKTGIKTGFTVLAKSLACCVQKIKQIRVRCQGYADANKARAG